MLIRRTARYQANLHHPLARDLAYLWNCDGTSLYEGADVPRNLGTRATQADGQIDVVSGSPSLVETPWGPGLYSGTNGDDIAITSTDYFRRALNANAVMMVLAWGPDDGVGDRTVFSLGTSSNGIGIIHGQGSDNWKWIHYSASTQTLEWASDTVDYFYDWARPMVFVGSVGPTHGFHGVINNPRTRMTGSYSASSTNGHSVHEVFQWPGKDVTLLRLAIWDRELSEAECDYLSRDWRNHSDLLHLPHRRIFDFSIAGAGAQTVTPTAMSSGEAFATAALSLAINAGTVASAEAFGTATLSLTVDASEVASAEAFATAIVSVGGLSLIPAALASGESFPTATISPGSVAITPASLASAESVPSPALALFLVPTAIASAESLATAALGLSIAPVALASGETFQTHIVSLDTISAVAIASAESFPSLQVLGNIETPDGRTLVLLAADRTLTITISGAH